MKKVILILVSVLVSCSKDSGNDEKEKPFFNLIVLANEGGTVNSSGGGYVEGTEITITASPNEGYEFDGWTGTTNSNENPLTILLLKNQKITANFKGKIYVDPINGITVKCPYAIIGDVAEINGKSYTVVNSTSKIREIIDDFDENTCACTSQVERMTGLFEDSPVYENIEDWDTSNVENMNGMFSFSSNFNQDLGYWNTSNVTSMSYMFEGTEFNQDIGSWNVSNVRSMNGMFKGSEFNQDIGSWNVSNVLYMSNMFDGAIFNRDIGNWDTSSVIDMHEMFRNSSFNFDINNWDTSSVTNMSEMFRNSSFNFDISNWDTSSVTNMQTMFNEAASFNQDLSNWDVVRVNKCSGFSNGASSWTLPEPNFTNCNPN